MRTTIKYRILLAIASIFACVVIPATASASYQNINITVSPDTPSANQEVTISIESYTVNLNAADIIWSVNKQLMKEGIGEKTFTTRTLDFGETVTVDITILSRESGRIDKQIVLVPEEVDLLWEANTYVPPFYKGKALPTYKSTVKVSAIPRFNSLASDPKQYYYKWTMNGTRGLGEGLGRTSTLVPVGWPDSHVSVTADVSLDKDPQKKGRASQTLTVVNPLLLLYEDAPLLGVRFNKTLANTDPAEGTDFRIHAFPYFFSLDDHANGSLVYKWRKDGVNIQNGIDPSIMILPKNGEGAQSVIMRLSVQNAKRVLQEARASAVINFKAEQ